MLKFLGSGIALAVGAGAIYYWWTHEHGDVKDEMEHAGDHLRDTAGKAEDAIDKA